MHREQLPCDSAGRTRKWMGITRNTAGKPRWRSSATPALLRDRTRVFPGYGEGKSCRAATPHEADDGNAESDGRVSPAHDDEERQHRDERLAAVQEHVAVDPIERPHVSDQHGLDDH